MSVVLYNTITAGNRGECKQTIKVFDDEADSLIEEQRCELVSLADGTSVCQSCNRLTTLVTQATLISPTLPPSPNARPTNWVTETSYPYHLLHSTFSSLSSCSSGGCAPCSSIRRQLHSIIVRSSMDLQRLRTVKDIEVQYRTWPEGIDLYNSKTLARRLEFHARHANGDRIWATANADDDKASDDSTSTSIDLIENIYACLQECLESHDECQNRHTASVFPGRLINCEGEDGEDVYLIDECKGVAYCALSYCWGNENSNYGVTTWENVEGRRVGFSLKELPKTISDAILICRRLGVLYLWVDALCILQDDPDDWEDEAPKMSGIYSQALFTLVASSSGNANEGLFVPEPPAQSFKLGGSTFRFDPSPLDDILSGPVTDRAWTLQEDILSTRKVYWTLNGVFFSCKRHIKEASAGVSTPVLQEGSSLSNGQILSSGQTPTKTNFALSENRRAINDTFVSGTASSTDIYLAWNIVRDSYLYRKITKVSDRTPAIIGLATAIVLQAYDHYLWGLWKSNLARDLFWEVKPRDSRQDLNLGPLEVPRGIPSWSWAWIPGDLEARYKPYAFFGFFKGPPPIALEIIEISTSSNNVPVGCLTLRAPRMRLIDMKLYHKHGAPESKFCTDHERPRRYQGGLGLDLFFDDYWSAPEWDSLYCLAVCTSMGENGGRHWYRDNEIGLLIRPVGDSEFNTFQRMGLWSAFWTAVEGDVPEELVEGKKVLWESNFLGCETYITKLV